MSSFKKTKPSVFQEHFGSFKMVLNYVLTDLEKRPRSFKIGVFSIFLVVSFLVILQSALQLTPIIFVRIAEDKNGQYDLTMTPVAAENDTRVQNGNSNRPTIRALNLSEIEDTIKDMPEVAGVSPRWILPVSVSRPGGDFSFQTVSIILDSEKERLQGFGKNLKVPDLKDGECWITDTVRRLLKIQGNEIDVKLDILGTLSKLQTFSIGGELAETDTIKKLVDTFIANNPNVRDGKIGVDISNFGIDTTAVKLTLTAVRIALLAATNWDGSINAQRLNALLQLSTGLTQPIPEELLANVNAQEVKDILDLIEMGLEQGSVEIDVASAADAAIPIITKALNLQERLTISTVIDSPRGKWPEDLGNVVVMDSKYIVKMFTRGFMKAIENANFDTGNGAIDLLLHNVLKAPQFEKTILDATENFNIDHYALTVNILLNNRSEIYTDQDNVRQHLLKVSDHIYTKLGRDHPSTITSSLELIINGLFIFKNFLDNIFNCTVFILILLSVLLIYSLMHSNIEEKTYEFGMLRALGMKQTNLIILLGLQSLFFAIPGLLLGMILAFAVNVGISYFVFSYSSLPKTYDLSPPAIITGLAIALFVPFASNIIPIRRALSKTLRDSLNIYHRVVSDMTVRILKLAQLGISPAQTVGSVTLVTMGFLAYYIAPYTFVFQNFTVFFLILTTVLMLLMLGFTLIVNLLQPWAERAILKIIMLIYRNDRLLEPVILKNLGAHKNRNTKTSLMFSIALSFLIFAGTSFRLNSSLIVDQLKAGLGADIVIKSLPMERSSLKENDLRNMLNQYMKEFPDVIRAYGFASKPYTTQPEAPWLRICPLSGSPSMSLEVVSVDEDYLKATYEDFYLPTAYDPLVKLDKLLDTKKLNAIQGLYQPDGLETFNSYDAFQITSNAAYRDLPELNSLIGQKEVRIIVPAGVSLSVSAEVGTPTLIISRDMKFRARVRSTATKFPGFFFTGYRALFKSTVLTSHEDYRYMTDRFYERITYGPGKDNIDRYRAALPPNTTENVPKHNLLVRLNPGVDRETRLGLYNTLQTLVDGQFSFVVDVVGTSESLESSLQFIDIFFILVSIIAISLSFFFTLVSFVSNITESYWEFGILRAVGLDKEQMTKLYIFEALSIIIAAGILGTIVGVIVAATTTIQFNLFTELPFRFLFPTTVFLFTIVISILTSVFGSKAAVDEVKDKQISTIIRALE